MPWRQCRSESGEVCREWSDEPARQFFLGLDLGQSSDPTARVILEEVPGKEKAPSEYRVHDIYRYPLGTPYPEIVSSVGTMLGKEPLLGQVALVVDGTGVGTAVVDSFRAARLNPISVVIHGGEAVTRGDYGVYRVPKRNLASCLQVLLQTKRLKIHRDLPHASALTSELGTFKVKISVTGHDSYEAWREKDHDDLVLACGIACWYAMEARRSYGVT